MEHLAKKKGSTVGAGVRRPTGENLKRLKTEHKRNLREVLNAAIIVHHVMHQRTHTYEKSLREIH
jgi:hypothetical protein